MAKDVAALKAVSQNLMHANLSITDGVYGILSDLDVKNKIVLLGRAGGETEGSGVDDLSTLIHRLDDVLRGIKGLTSG